MPAEHRQRGRVAWADTDAGGRIHFTAVFRWAESAEVALRRRLGIGELERYPRRHAEAEYLAVLRFDDEFELAITPGHVGTSSIRWDWVVTHDGRMSVRGRYTTVYVDDDGRPAALPADVRERLQAPNARWAD